MLVCFGCSLPATWGTFQKTLLDQERLIYFFYSAAFFSYRCSNGIQSHRATFELVNNRDKDLIIHVIETMLINIQSLQRMLRYAEIDNAIMEYLGKVAHPSQ